ncbi:CheR family methyltransferase [Microbacterium sp. A1-JK]|uniref:CheR family methyltransferase n=1 Tax=Microbacterium sp. A1-JK TaxID=3177516 RepID=UPI0038890E8B
MSIPPTRWFRMAQSWHLIAAALKTRAANGRPQAIRIIGVATGQEAYSLAMILEHLEIPGHILATDINPELIDYASAAVYTDEHVREAMTAGVLGPVEVLNFFANLASNVWTVTPPVRSRVTFGVADAGSDPLETCDMALARNVWTYIGARGRAHLLAELRSAIPAGGIVATGGSDFSTHDSPHDALPGFTYAGAAGLYVRD